MKNDFRAKASIAIVLSILAFVITWQLKSVRLNQGQGTISGLRSAELQNLYQKEKEKNEALWSDYLRISNDLERYKEAANDTNATTKLLKEQLDNAEILSGLKEVTGKGVIVKMNDSKFATGSEGNDNLYVLHDADILLVIIELRDAGASLITSISAAKVVAATLNTIVPAKNIANSFFIKCLIKVLFINNNTNLLILQ